MKLYANIIGKKQGQDVEKGQGSNQSLAIEILAEGLQGIPTRANIYRLSLNVGNNNELEAELLDYSTGEKTLLTKAKRQKGECRNKDANDNPCWDCEMGGLPSDCGQTTE